MSPEAQKSIARAKAQRKKGLESFSTFEQLPIGTKVLLRLDDGTIFPTETRSKPWILGDGTAVINIVGRCGGYSLDRVRIVPVEVNA